jgi:hypothetical protein
VTDPAWVDQGGRRPGSKLSLNGYDAFVWKVSDRWMWSVWFGFECVRSERESERDRESAKAAAENDIRRRIGHLKENHDA